MNNPHSQLAPSPGRPNIYQLTLVAQPGEVDETRRLARFLKMAKRSYGFRCTNVVKVESQPEAR